MRRRLKYILFFVLGFSILIFSCTKDQETTSASALKVPAIKFVNVTPASITEYKDSLTFEIAYVDNDGDLGQNDPSVYNLFLTDNRVNITYQFRIPQLAPDNANVTITGHLSVVLKNTCITDGSNSQSAYYSIYVTDRAGNKSNKVISTSVNIHN